MHSSLKNDKQALVDFAKRHKLRDDWHESENQEVEAGVVGHHLDNAMGNDLDSGEYVIILEAHGKGSPEVLHVNLATLLAIAAAE